MEEYIRKSIRYLFDNYVQATQGSFTNSDVGTYIRNTIPQNFLETDLIDKNIYSIKASVGQANWAQVPWVGIFNTKITNSAMNGVYIVYLLAADGKSIYLTLNQGFTDIANDIPKRQAISQMRALASRLVKTLSTQDFYTDDNINLGKNLTNRAEMYQRGTILYKCYTSEDLPSENLLRKDLTDMLGVYHEYYEKIFMKEGVKNDHKELYSPKNIEANNMSVKKIDNLILYGPPGTGKTYKMQHEYIDKFAKKDRFITTFHQSFSYEEFVEGLKPVLADKPDGEKSSDVKYKIEKGIFYKACERAAELAGYESKKDESETPLQKCIADVDRSTKMDEAIKNNKIVLLCIDEINRANVSAVFGDLISLIEPSKRIGADNEMIVQLPYSKEDFAVPANLMIVGTMNTADRSIQLLDSALRRRFRFEELLPNYEKIENTTAKEILQKINARIRCLLDKDHQIGHSYFIEAKNDLDIFNALKDSVIPLLEEYFYNDAQKIRQILNENEESENNFYIKDEEAENASRLIQNDYDDEKAFYQLNPKLSEVKDEDSAASFISHIVPKSD